jgi:Uma2 family endonuclease
MNLLLTDAVSIPGKATTNLRAFRRWSTSGQYPDHGDYFYLAGDIWMDNSMETLLHNHIKGLFQIILGGLILQVSLGRYCGDRMRLVNVQADFSCEPDGMFISRESLRAGNVRWDQGNQSLEVTGKPDMVLEVASSSSLKKDSLLMRQLYAAASIPEYWLVNPLGDQIIFDILRLQGSAYAPVRKSAGWVKSGIFGRSFRLIEEESKTTPPEYRLLVK